MDTVLGVSLAPAAIQMVLLEGENADGVTIEEDEFHLVAADDEATASTSDQVIAAILGTRQGAIDAGLEVSSIGVSWTDQREAAALRDALTAHRIDNVMLVSAFLAAAALTQSLGGAMGYERTAVFFVEPDTVTLALVETSDGSITEAYKEYVCAASDDDAVAQLTGMLDDLDESESAPEGLFVVGSGVDVAPLKPVLESATSLDVSVPEEPHTALARGAALASANAPLFVSSTAALAYAQDPGAGAVGGSVVPAHVSSSGVPAGAEPGDDDLAYSAVPDEDAEAPTALIEELFLPEDNQPRRRPVLLIGSGLAVAGISAVLALEIALAIGIRSTVALQPNPGQHLIVPTRQAPAPAEAPAPRPKISPPKAVAAPKPLAPPVAAPVPAAAAPPVPAAPVMPIPVVAPPVVPVPAPPIHVPAPVVSVPAPQRVIIPPAVHVPRPQSPPHGGGTAPLSPPHHIPPGQGTGGAGGRHLPAPGVGPGGPGGGGGSGHDRGGPGGPGGGGEPSHGPGGLGGPGGGHLPAPGVGPGGPGGGGEPSHGPGESGGPGGPGGPGPLGGGPPGGHGGGPFGGGGFGHGGGFGGGGPFGGGFGHGGGFGGGGPFGGGGFGHGGGFGGSGFGGFGGFGGGGHH